VLDVALIGDIFPVFQICLLPPSSR